MTHAELLNIALSAHGAVFLGSLAAFYKYGDRTDVFAKSLEGTNSVLSKLRMMISDELLTAIKGCLSAVPTKPKLILGSDGNAVYSEDAAYFIESDSFRQVVRDFIDLRAERISDYQVLMRARSKWCFWAKVLSWSIWLSIILQLVFLITHGFVDYVLGHSLPNWGIYATLAISGFVVLFVICLLPFLLLNHDVILQQKVKYDAP